jgi:hypothetical protein
MPGSGGVATAPPLSDRDDYRFSCGKDSRLIDQKMMTMEWTP